MPNDPGQEIAPTQNRGVAAVFQADLDAYTPNLEQALPPHVSVDKFKRVLVTAVSSNPDLLYANRRTLFNAAVRCAADGLMPDGREAALVVYNTKIKQRNPETGLDVERRIDAVQYLPMVAGIRKRMRNTGEVLSADAHVVYENDRFKYKLGDDGFIDHEPAGLSEDPGKALGAYAIIKLKGGEVLRDVMRYADIERARAVSRAKDGPMWTKWWDEAARKTVLRRCSKAAPQSAELESLLNRDEEEPPMMPAFDALPAINYEPEPQRPEPEPIEDDRPFYTVVDLDGVEHEFREEATAVEALHRLLDEAAKQGIGRLDGVWDSNKQPEMADAIVVYYETLRKRLEPVKPDPAPKPRHPKRVAVADPAPPGADNSEKEREISEAVSTPTVTTSSPQQPWPLDDPRPFATTDTLPPGDDGGSGDGSRKDGSGPTVTTAASPSDDNDDPDRGSLAIPPPIRRGQPDWRTWTIALFLPKVRKAATSSDLAFLVGDNDENLTKAKAALDRDDKTMLEEAIAQRWREIGDTP